MKLFLLLVLACLALYNAKGAPTAARYMFVTCNPNGDQANCVTQQGPEMPWSPDLPAQLPASSAKHLEAEPVEDEHPDREEEGEEEAERQTFSDEGESPMSQYEDGSGDYEGSTYAYAADQQVWPTESDTGSGEADVDSYIAKTFFRKSLSNEKKTEEEELKQDHLLKL